MNKTYLENVRRLLDHVENEEAGVIDEVSKVCAGCIANGGLLYFFGTGHSHMVCEEPFYRAGGLAQISPLLHSLLMLHDGASASSAYERLPGIGTTVVAQSALKEGDVLFCASNSGRNAACIDAALEAKRRGAKTVAVTSVRHSSSVSSRHASGKRLYEVCDYVLDNGGCPGDACVKLNGMKESIGPTSSVIDLTMVNLVMIGVCEELVSRGIPPVVFTSANLDSGDRLNASIIAEYKKRVPIL